MRDLDALIQDNRGLVYQIARRYLSACQRDNAVDADDLIQGGMIGLMEAAQTWDPERGAWSTHAALHIRNGMRAALGLRHRNPTRHQGLASLDKPIASDDGEAAAPVDLLADPDAIDPGDNAARLDTIAQVRRAVDALPDDLAAVVRCMDLQGLDMAQTAQALALPLPQVRALRARALAALRKSPQLRPMAREHAAQALAHMERQDSERREAVERLRQASAIQLRELLTGYDRGKGVVRFESERSSVVEDAVLWRDGFNQQMGISTC